MITLRSEQEIEKMRQAGALLASSFVSVFDMIEPGVETIKLNDRIESNIVAGDAVPSFKGYPNHDANSFPATTCISIDEEIVHGIPSKRKLKNGEVVGIDAGLILDGWHADMACSLPVVSLDNTRRKLWTVTREALYKGIDAANPGNTIEDIGRAIQTHVEAAGFNVIRELVGHGIGRNLHEEPQVPNYQQRKPVVRLKPGMTIAIEPMVSVGSWRIKTLDDGWTATTIDSTPTAHFEHTIAVTENGARILTLLPDDRDPWKLLEI